MNEIGTISPQERLESESARAFAAFCVFRDMPPSIRSVDGAYRLQQQNNGKTAAQNARAPRHWWDWYSLNEWSERVELHDLETSRRQFTLACQQQTASIQEAHDHTWELARIGRALAGKAALRLNTAFDGKAASVPELLALARTWTILSQSASQAESIATGTAGLLQTLAERETLQKSPE